jgi:hypothetical protein
MLRKLIASGLVVAATLVAVPTVLAALRSESAFGAPFAAGGVATRGWMSRLPVDARRLRVGLPVAQKLTIVNAGSLTATYELDAQIAGDRVFARHLDVVATRSADGATVFSGPVTAMHAVSLGRFDAHVRESFRLQVTLEPGGVRDNALQSRAASVSFGWIATQG